MTTSEKIKQHAEGYIAKCWPDGCPPLQAIEVKLAFYAGMRSHYEILLWTLGRHGDDMDAQEAELQETFKAINDRAMQLNEERATLRS